MPSKADYVRSQPQTREHHCHWPGCGKSVPPAMWGCRLHWFTLPKPLRDKIWNTYRPGQEIDGTPSAAYLAAAAEVQAWIQQHVLQQARGRFDDAGFYTTDDPYFPL